jgi:two-component system sensor histidine kinase/response regulator
MGHDESTPESSDPGVGFGLRILIADDTFITQAMMVARLKKLGCEVAVADNGREAVRAVQTSPVDCIFMDYHMPILDGVAATKQIRAWEAEQIARGEGKPPVYIVAFTATSQVRDRATMSAVGMDDFLSKPMTVGDLVGVLRRVVARQ